MHFPSPLLRAATLPYTLGGRGVQVENKGSGSDSPLDDGQLTKRHLETVAALDKVADRLAAVASLLEQRQALVQTRETSLRLLANSPRTISLPKGCGGFIIDPQGADVSVITVRISGLAITFPADTKIPVFVPAFGNTSEAALISTAAIAIIILTLSPEYAIIAASTLPRE